MQYTARGVSGAAIAVILIIVLRKIIIRPLLDIGTTVREVGQGNLEIQVSVRSNDEAGELGEEINNIIRGLEERFHLSKYVSRTTEELVSTRGGVSLEGRKKRAAVLFSDIRNGSPE